MKTTPSSRNAKTARLIGGNSTSSPAAKSSGAGLPVRGVAVAEVSVCRMGCFLMPGSDFLAIIFGRAGAGWSFALASRPAALVFRMPALTAVNPMLTGTACVGVLMEAVPGLWASAGIRLGPSTGLVPGPEPEAEPAAEPGL